MRPKELGGTMHSPVSTTPNANPAALIPLDRVRPNQPVVLARIDGGCGLSGRLTEMGLRPGVRFTVLNPQGGGPIILAIGDTRLVVGHGMASRVMVLPAT